MQRPADDFSGFADGAFDAVVLNSVVQYFPDVDYLLGVLAEAVRVVRPGGHVFVGDVRNRALLEVFHASLQLRQASDSLPVEQLIQRVRKKASQERELVIDPTFFPALKGYLPQVGHVEIQLKRGCHRNEMTAFRYDVVLHVGPNELSVRETTWLDYRESELTLAEVRRRLKEERPDVLAITGVPNARIPAQAVALVRFDPARGTVGDLQRAPEEAGVDPEEFWQLGESQAYAIDMRWTPGTADGRFDVVFRRRNLAAVPFREKAGRRPWSDYANEPLRGKAKQEFALELRGHLKDRLPEYMVPSAFVLLDALPQTPNGKIDRKTLPAPDHDRPDGTVAFVAPRTPTEEILARAGAEVLGLEQVGVHDNFFDLGGHSLQAVQFVARISKALGRDVPVKALFLHPTVAALAEALESGGAAPTGRAAPDRNGAASSAMPLDEDRLTALAPQLIIERRPMMPLFESGELPPVRAAAIGYLPSALLKYTGLSPRDIIEGGVPADPL